MNVEVHLCRVDGCRTAVCRVDGCLGTLPPPLVSQCEAHGPPIGVGREKNGQALCTIHFYIVVPSYDKHALYLCVVVIWLVLLSIRGVQYSVANQYRA